MRLEFPTILQRSPPWSHRATARLTHWLRNFRDVTDRPYHHVISTSQPVGAANLAELLCLPFSPAVDEVRAAEQAESFEPADLSFRNPPGEGETSFDIFFFSTSRARRSTTPGRSPWCPLVPSTPCFCFFLSAFCFMLFLVVVLSFRVVLIFTWFISLLAPRTRLLRTESFTFGPRPVVFFLHGGLDLSSAGYSV